MTMTAAEHLLREPLYHRRVSAGGRVTYRAVTEAEIAAAFALPASIPPTPTPLPPTPAPPPIPAGIFLEAFDGTPAAPLPFRSSPRWDVTIHSRDHHAALLSMLAEHGPGCEPPPASHEVRQYEDACYVCASPSGNGHVHTAINDDGYGAVRLTPACQVDFSAGEAVVSFDVTTARTSGRDWLSLWVTPFAEVVQMPLHFSTADGVGEPRRSIHLNMEADALGPDGPPSRTFWSAAVIQDFVGTVLPRADYRCYEDVLTPSPTRRDTYELRLSRTRLRFGMPAYDLWWIDTPLAPLDWSRGVVQFGHHSYNPYKNETGTPPEQWKAGPNTWAWDNVRIEPAVPFAMLPGLPRSVSRASERVDFADGAPAGAVLRFMALSGIPIEVSLDGGATWASAAEQPGATRRVPVWPGDYPPHTFLSYWQPVPAGTRAVQVRGAGSWWGDRWLARDFALWSESA